MTPDALKAALAEHALWRRGNGGKRLDLRGAVLRGLDLRGLDLSGADLSGANLRGADLRGAVLRGADLRGAVLRGADLSDAVLSGAVLSVANLNGADLSGAVLSGADLNGAHGNMRELKSAQIDTWPVTWITDPDTGPILQIGCQRHPLEMWEKADPRWLAKMDMRAAEWADKHLAMVCQLVRAFPAVPYGRATQ